MFKIDLPPDSSWKWETRETRETSIDGQDQPCYYCGKLCNNFAGDPTEWSISYPEKGFPGKMQYHHMGCLLKRLNLLEEVADIVYILLGDNFTKPIRKIANQWLEDYSKLNKGI